MSGSRWLRKVKAEERFKADNGFLAPQAKAWAHGYEFSVFVRYDHGDIVLYCSSRPSKDAGSGEKEYVLNRDGKWEEFKGSLPESLPLPPAPVPVFDPESVE